MKIYPSKKSSFHFLFLLEIFILQCFVSKHISKKPKNRVRNSLLVVQELLIVSRFFFFNFNLSVVKIFISQETSFQSGMFHYVQEILQTWKKSKCIEILLNLIFNENILWYEIFLTKKFNIK